MNSLFIFFHLFLYKSFGALFSIKWFQFQLFPARVDRWPFEHQALPLLGMQSYVWTTWTEKCLFWKRYAGSLPKFSSEASLFLKLNVSTLSGSGHVTPGRKCIYESTVPCRFKSRPARVLGEWLSLLTFEGFSDHSVFLYWNLMYRVVLGVQAKFSNISSIWPAVWEH